MANGTIHKLGTLYVNNTKYPFPTMPWRTDQTPTGTSGAGNILNYDSVNGNIEIRNTDSDDANQLRWIEVNDGDKKLLISDRCLLTRVTFDELNAQGLVSGKEITIDGKRYKIRLLSGGTNYRSGSDNYSGGSPTTNEWDRIITNESSFAGIPKPTSTDLDTSQNATDFNGAHNQIWNWYYMYSWCQEVYSGNSSALVSRGFNSARCFNYYSSNTSSSIIGWRPALEVLNSAPTISIQNQDLGNNLTPITKNYSVTDVDGDSFALTEKLNGSTIRTLANQVSGTSYTLDLTSRWDSLDYGKHTAEIIATDNNIMFGKSNTVTITFTKIKSPITKPPVNASLVDLANFTEEQNKELVYQCYKLRNFLSEKGITVSESDKMSSLVDKVANIETEKHNFPAWYKTNDIWVTATVMPTARRSPASSSVGTNIYCIGGHTGSTTNVNECYDTLTNTWSTKTVMPTARYSLTSSVVGANIYVIGGDGLNKNENECYDTITNTWSTKAVMPTARSYLTSSTVGANIYVIGGNAGSITNKNECYDTISDTWSTKTVMPTARKYLTSSIVGDNIYCIGGDTGSITNINECYDTVSNTWSTKTVMPTARQYLISSTVGTNIYCIGGNVNVNECYDTVSNTWSTKSVMPTSRYDLTSSTVDSNIYCIGGYASSFMKTNEVYIP